MGICAVSLGLIAAPTWAILMASVVAVCLPSLTIVFGPFGDVLLTVSEITPRGRQVLREIAPGGRCGLGNAESDLAAQHQLAADGGR